MSSSLCLDCNRKVKSGELCECQRVPYHIGINKKDKCACSFYGKPNPIMTQHSEYSCSNGDLGIMKA